MAALALAVVALFRGGGGASTDILYSFSSSEGLAQQTAIGKQWAVGAIPLCLQDGGQVTLTSIQPALKHGAIQLDGIAVRRVTRDTTIPEMKGVPSDLRPVAGFVLRSPAPCNWPHSTSKFYEVIVVANRKGPGSGWVKGLTVSYRAGKASGTYTIPFTFALCSANATGRPCKQT
jgi:hypothetical protein